ncbi:hypothetical protein GCM10009776_33870 [Microbacterium deminutum]|uniref:Uncharacterized protein n=1 Tax=Microbacterium deminutum TaxID=344164 RepID=A0ABN2RF91_9MICO
MDDRDVAIEDHDVVGDCIRLLQRACAVVDDVGGHTGIAQALRNPICEHLVVLDDEYSHGPIVRLPG